MHHLHDRSYHGDVGEKCSTRSRLPRYKRSRRNHIRPKRSPIINIIAMALLAATMLVAAQPENPFTRSLLSQAGAAAGAAGGPAAGEPQEAEVGRGVEGGALERLQPRRVHRALLEDARRGPQHAPARDGPPRLQEGGVRQVLREDDAHRDDLGREEVSSEVQTSLSLATQKKVIALLRGHKDYGIEYDDAGFFKIAKVAAIFGITTKDLEDMQALDNKNRIEIRSSQDIRARQGHSLRMNVLTKKLGEQVYDASSVVYCVHGTFLRAASQIEQQGLKRCSRKTIHFASTDPTSRGQGISGMRADSEVFFHLDVYAALDAGIELYKTPNGVYITEGLNGIIPPRYILRHDGEPPIVRAVQTRNQRKQQEANEGEENPLPPSDPTPPKEWTQAETFTNAWAGGLSQRVSSPCCIEKESEHREDSHFPYDPDCPICVRAAKRKRKHIKGRHSLREDNFPQSDRTILSFDIASATPQGPFVLVGVARVPSKQGLRIPLAIPIPSKKNEAIQEALTEFVLQCEHLYSLPLVRRVHSDREGGYVSPSTQRMLMSLFITCTLTEGNDPMANGDAEAMVGQLSRLARSCVLPYTTREARLLLWQYAMVHAAYRIATTNVATWNEQNAEDKLAATRVSSTDILPFGCRVYYRPSEDPEKVEPLEKPALYLYPDAFTVLSSAVLPLTNNDDGQPVVTTTNIQCASKVTPETARQGEGRRYVYPDVQTTQTRIGDLHPYPCPNCKQTRWLLQSELRIAKSRSKKGRGALTCRDLWAVTCTTNEKDAPRPCRIILRTGDGNGRSLHFSPTCVECGAARQLRDETMEEAQRRVASGREFRCNWVKGLKCGDSPPQSALRILKTEAIGPELPYVLQEEWVRHLPAFRHEARENQTPLDVLQGAIPDGWRLIDEDDPESPIIPTDRDEHLLYPQVRVTRPQTRDDAATQGGFDARQKEIGKMYKYRAWGRPITRNEVRKRFPNDTWSRLHLLQLWKYAELPIELQEQRARLVVAGDRIYEMIDDTLSKLSKRMSWSPTASMAESRSVMAHHALLRAFGIESATLESADIEGAYLQSKWPKNERTHWLLLPEEVYPHLSEEDKKLVDQMGGIQNVYFPMQVAMYGHPLSGKVFVDQLLDLIKVQGWETHPGGAALLRREHDLLACYVDDLLLSTTAPMATLWEEVRERFTFPDAEPAKRFLGMTLEQGFALDANNNIACYWTAINMRDYTKSFALAYMQDLQEAKQYNRLRRLQHKRWTPVPEDLAARMLRDEIPYKNDPKGLKERQGYVGKILWIARTARYDVSYAVSNIGSRMHRWTKAMEEVLDWLVSYLRTTIDVLCYMNVGTADAQGKHVYIAGLGDSDWDARPSQTGYWVGLLGLDGLSGLTTCPLAWGSNRQSIAANASKDSEWIAAHATTREALGCLEIFHPDNYAQEGVRDARTNPMPIGVDEDSPLHPSREQPTQIKFPGLPIAAQPATIATDNTACQLSVVKGDGGGTAAYRRAVNCKLNYLERLSKLKIISIQRVATDDNPGDLGTKALGRVAVTRERLMAGFRTREEQVQWLWERGAVPKQELIDDRDPPTIEITKKMLSDALDAPTVSNEEDNDSVASEASFASDASAPLPTCRLAHALQSPRAAATVARLDQKPPRGSKVHWASPLCSQSRISYRIRTPVTTASMAPGILKISRSTTSTSSDTPLPAGG